MGDFFGFTVPTKGTVCYGGHISTENSKYFYEFSYSHDGKDYGVGRAELERQDDGYFNLLSLWLPKTQKVFKSTWAETETVTHIAYYKPTTYFKGEYRSFDGSVSRPISIEAKPLGSITVGGILNGKYYFDVFAGF